MGGHQSHLDDPEDSSVEALRYHQRRPTKITRSNRNKSSKKNVTFTVAEGDNPENGEANSDCSPAESTFSNKDLFGKQRNKSSCERVKIFGHKATRSMLTLSVDTPEAADIEARQGKFGTRHVFPVWESHYKQTCQCVNTDSNDETAFQDDGRKLSSRLCSKCSHVIVNNTRRPVNNNNNSSSSVVEASEASTSRPDATLAVPGNSGDAVGLNKDGVGLPLLESSKQIQLTTIANLLSLAALDLSAPASSLVAKNRKNAWIQLAGHPGSFAPAGPSTIWKKRISKENYEVLAYTAFSEHLQSQNIMPAFYREVEFNGEYFIEIEDLLHHFIDPSIMDIKMGTRTFLEEEVKNPVLRKDLYEKMVKVDPNAPTAEEKAEGAVTKLRYMQFREQESSTASLGFRIEAIRMSGEPPNTNLKKVKTKEEVSYFLETFLHGHEVVIPSLYERLSLIRQRFESIPFFSTHEVIGSSLLIMFDPSNHAGAWMIDFAKTIPVDDHITLNHRSPWLPGNHEDGYLFGIDNLIEILNELVKKHNESANDCIKSSS